MASYLTAIFGACHLCHAEFGHQYDQDAITVQEARAALGEKIRRLPAQWSRSHAVKNDWTKRFEITGYSTLTFRPATEDEVCNRPAYSGGWNAGRCKKPAVTRVSGRGRYTGPMCGVHAAAAKRSIENDRKVRLENEARNARVAEARAVDEAGRERVRAYGFEVGRWDRPAWPEVADMLDAVTKANGPTS